MHFQKPSLIAGAVLALCAGLASAADVDARLTADNEFWLYTGNAAASNLVFVGEGHNWGTPYSFSFNVAPGDYLYVLANDGGPPKSWVGTFQTPLGALVSNDTQWVGTAVSAGTQAVTTALVTGATWTAPQLSSYPWGNVVQDSNAKWIWMGDQYSGPQTALFRSALPVAAAVPEPGSWAMLAGGLAMLALRRRRRAD